MTDAGSGDAGPQLDMSELFGECEADWQCPGEGAICRTAFEGYPGGYCTVPCVDRTPCDARGVYHHCVRRDDAEESFCERRCINGLDCGRETYTCAGEIPPSGGFCFGVCSTDEDCGGGAVCDPFTGVCAETLDTSGSVTGEVCTDADSCRSGICNPEENTAGQPTGWVGGYCLSNCILPPGYNQNDFFAGDALPAGSCPTGTICWPANGANTAMRDRGLCVVECTSQADCRPGYSCIQDIPLRTGGTSSYSNGVCFPGNCLEDGCPSGYTCQPVTDSQGNTRNVCGR